MDTINYYAPMAGFLLLVGGTITAAIALLFYTVEVKRIIVLVGVLFFSGAFLVLYERITILELPASLGKITVQAKQDAKEIRDIRIKMEAQNNTVTAIVEKVSATADHVSALAVDIETQQKTMTGLVAKMKETSSRVSALSTETESKLYDLRNKMEAQNNTVTAIVDKVSATADHVSALAVDIETQQKTVTDLVAKMKETSSWVSALSTETESKFSDVRKSQIADRKQYLRNQLEEVIERINTFGTRLEHAQRDNDSFTLSNIYKQNHEDMVKKKELLIELKALKD